MTSPRKNPRLRSFNYTASGMYFITICCAGRRRLFDSPSAKQIAETCWEASPEHFSGVGLDEFVVMPNHVHGIIAIDDPESEQASDQPSRGPSLGIIVGAFKSAVARRVGLALPSVDSVWQRNYYEHVIRNEPDLNRIREYIRNNPGQWQEDPYFAP